jgi:hypothetical protein
MLPDTDFPHLPSAPYRQGVAALEVTAHGFRFSVRGLSAEADWDGLADLFADLTNAPARAEGGEIEVRLVANRTVVSLVGGPILSSASGQVTPGLLANSIGLAGLERDGNRLHLHAACLARGGRGLVLVAPSGGGKSTLAAGLLRRGWDLLSDEAIGLLPGSRTVYGFPRPIALKGRAPAMLNLDAGQLVEDPDDRFLVTASRLGTIAQVCCPDVVAFPRVTAGPSRIRPIAIDDAMHRLLADCLDAGRMGPATVDQLATLVATTTVVSLDVGDLEQGLDLLEALEGPKEIRLTATSREGDGVLSTLGGVRCTLGANLELRTSADPALNDTTMVVPFPHRPDRHREIAHGPMIDALDGRPVVPARDLTWNTFTGLGPRVMHSWSSWDEIRARAVPVIVDGVPVEAMHPVDRLVDLLLRVGAGVDTPDADAVRARMLWDDTSISSVISTAETAGCVGTLRTGVRAVRSNLGADVLPATLLRWSETVDPPLSSVVCHRALTLALPNAHGTHPLKWVAALVAQGGMHLAARRASRRKRRRIRWRSLIPIRRIAVTPPTIEDSAGPGRMP